MKFGTIEPAAILSYRVIGLDFFLALLAYFLLHVSSTQRTGFDLVLCIAGFLWIHDASKVE